jgi:hypothetical protein
MDMTLISGAKEAKDTTPFDQLKLAIVGPPKGGKSRLAATAPATGARGESGILVNDFDGRAAALAGMPNVVIADFFDKSPSVATGWSNFNISLGKLEYAAQNKQFDKLPATIILDSITYAGRAAMRTVLGSGSISGVKKLTIGGFTTNIARGYEPYDAEMNMMEGAICRMFGLGIHVICIFHEMPEEAPDSTDDNPKFTGKVSVSPPRSRKLLPLFNEVWRIVPDSQGKRLVQVQPNYEFIGATCLSLDAKEEPSIMAMIEKHRSRTKTT